MTLVASDKHDSSVGVRSDLPRLLQFNRSTSIGNPRIIVYMLCSAACSYLIGRAGTGDPGWTNEHAGRGRAANGGGDEFIR